MNGAGLLILVASFVPALILAKAIGDDRDCVKMMIGGPLACTLDLIYRLKSPQRLLAVSEPGRQVLLSPGVECFGVFLDAVRDWEL